MHAGDSFDLADLLDHLYADLNTFLTPGTAAGFPVLDAWLESHEGTFNLVPPRAAAIAFARYHLDIDSTELVDRLINEKSVLIVPGDHFGLDHYLRISFGLPHDYLVPGLDRIHELIVELQG